MFNIFEYSIPFRSPFITASNTYNKRNGLIIEFTHQDNSYVCEAAPLPGFSKETTGDVKSILLKRKDELDIFFKSTFDVPKLNDFLGELPNFPSLQFALSYLGFEILADRKSNSRIQNLKNRPVKRILINEIIGAESGKNIQYKIENGIKNGFNTFKIKSPFPVDNLIENLKIACEKFPTIKLRLDANQSWPHDKLTEIGEKLRSLPIEYIEEPSGSVDPQKSQSILSIPVALDESIKSLEKLSNLLKTEPEFFVVIKPMLLGNFFTIIETISKYRSNYNNIVVTTSLESIIGRLMITNVAALVGDPDLAHGLNTGKYFTNDLIDNKPDIKGTFQYSEWCNTPKISDLNQTLITLCIEEY